jgi:hypothetical protein
MALTSAGNEIQMSFGRNAGMARENRTNDDIIVDSCRRYAEKHKVSQPVRFFMSKMLILPLYLYSVFAMGTSSSSSTTTTTTSSSE